jgi:uncharacterized protein YbjT (DUF2867 family)
MSAEILVTGAPGNVGSEVVKGLQAQGIPFRIGAFDVDMARQAHGDDLDVTHFDFLKPDTFAPTFDGIKRLFLVRPPALADVPKEIAPALQAGLDAGVKQIVFLSLQGVESQRVVPHYKIEQFILSSGADYTFLRASFFMQNLSTALRQEIRQQRTITVPVGKGKTSFIDVRDIGAVAVLALTGDTLYKKTPTLTGSEALDYYQVAEIMTRELGIPIRYTNPNPVSFFFRQTRTGSKLDYAFVTTMLYTITRFGNAKTVTPDVEQLLGRPPIPFEQFVRDFRTVWVD